MANAHHPVVVMQGIGQLGRNFLREVGSVFWFIAHTLDESIGRTSALWDRAADSRFGGNRFYARAGSADHRNHARGANRRSLHRGTRHDAGFRGSRSDRGDGHRAAAFSGRAENAGAFFPDALSFHSVEYRSDRRQQPGLARLLSITTVIGFDTLYNIVYTVFFPT